MKELFEAPELVRIAVEDERTGVAFYTAMVAKAHALAVKETFADLATQELYHLKRFGEMLDGMANFLPREQYSGEYMAYLRAITHTRAFPDERTALDMVAACDDDADFVDLAARFERDTLILLNELRGMVDPRDRPILDEIAREEQNHLVTLAEARAKL